MLRQLSDHLSCISIYLMCNGKSYHIWASTQENRSSGASKQQRFRSACASAQSDQRLCYSLIGNIISRLATFGISIFYLVSVTEQAGFNLIWRQDADRVRAMCFALHR